MENQKPRPHWILVLIYIGLAAAMLCLAIFRQQKGSPLLSFVLSVGWLALAVREVYLYFKEKADKD